MLGCTARGRRPVLKNVTAAQVEASTSYVVSQFAPPPRRAQGFRWDKRLLQRRLADVQQTTRFRKSGAHWVAVYGRLETAAKRTITRGNGQVAMTSGYGHLGSAPAQMVARSDCWLRLKARCGRKTALSVTCSHSRRATLHIGPRQKAARD